VNWESGGNINYFITPIRHNISSLANLYDLRLIDIAGNVYERHEEILTSDRSLTFVPENRTSKRYTILNDTNFRLISGFIRQQGANHWTDLSIEHLPNGVTIIPTSHTWNVPINTGLRYDLRFVDTHGNSYVKSNLPMANEDVVITFTESDRN
jgi:hypothetical protein